MLYIYLGGGIHDGLSVFLYHLFAYTGPGRLG
jgi:hypothetical protein